MPFEKELLQAKLYKFLIDPSIFLLPRYVMRMFRQIFGISLRKGSLGDGLAALSENGLFVEFKLCSANKLPQRITEAADSSETFFICVYDFPPETIRKLRSGRLKITMEEGKYGYIFDLARRELYKLTKNKKLALAKIENGKAYTIDEAAQLVKEITFTKFDASVDIDVRLGVDPRKANQMVRGVVTLPHGTGKEIRVLVLCTPDKAEEAKAAGAD